MKVIAINGSPRKKWNTAQLLREALRGAEVAGAETQLVNLYDLSYTGCISCLGCKRKGATPCHCYAKDGLTPVLDAVLQSDVLLLGSPVYFGNVSGQMRCFMERLLFPALSYDDFSAKVFSGHIDCAFFFTMNVGEEHLAGYEPMMNAAASLFGYLGGSTEKYVATNTLQFSDYSKYNASGFNEADKIAWHEQQFPKDLAAAYEIGFRLAKGKAG